MGYTHYWKRKDEYDARAFKEAVADVRLVVGVLWQLLANADGTGAPEIEVQGIALNGRGEEAHEGFWFPRVRTADEAGRELEWCKTARKPYDLAVMAILVVLAHHLDLTVTSDGNADEWEPAARLCQGLLGYGQVPVGRDTMT